MDILKFQKNGGTRPVGNLLPNGKRDYVTSKGEYYIELDVVAVNKYESLLSSYEKEQDLREFGLTPKVVTPERHNYSYIKMLRTIEEAEKAELIDVTNVYKRGKQIGSNGVLKDIEQPKLIYSSKDSNESNTIFAIENERQKEIKELIDNPIPFLKRIEKLKQRITQKGIQEQMERLDSLEQEFVAEVENNRKTFIDNER